MMVKPRANDRKIKREEGDLRSMLEVLPTNPIPWTMVIKVLAPIVARLAARYALRKLGRDLGEDKVNAIGKATGDFIGGIVEKRTGDPTPVGGPKEPK